MFDRYFSLALVAALLIAGTLAIGFELFRNAKPAQPSPSTAIATLPRVVVVGHTQPVQVEMATIARGRDAAPTVE